MSTTQLSFNDYFAVCRRRKGLMLLVFSVVFLLTTLVALLLPPVYQSSSIIMVESQRIPAALVAIDTTSVAEERIEIIKQRVMTQANLLNIIDKYHLFKGDGGVVTTSEKVDAMRKQLGVEFISAGKGRSAVTIAFTLSYQDASPNVAHKVTNDLVTLFLDENVRARTERASETAEFLREEAERLKVELESLEKQLADYKQRHKNSLPELLDLQMQMQLRTESELKDVQREYKATQEELRYLDVELAAAKSRPAAAGGAQSPLQELNRLKAEYEATRYNENHPDVRALKRKIETLEASVKQGKPGEGVDVDVARVEAKIAAANSRLSSLSNQERMLRAKLGGYESQIVETPQVERGMSSLMRDHMNAQKKYDEIRSKLMNAELNKNMEEENQAERFVLLEPPVLPDKPVKPQRMKIILGGLFGAIILAFGLAFFLEMLGQRIYAPAVVTLQLRQAPLVVIPYIRIAGEHKQNQVFSRKLIIGFVIALLFVMLLLHFIYMPLDILVLKMMARLA